MLKSRKEIMMKGKKIMLSKEGNYGNWVPANMMKLMWAGDIVLAVLTIVFAAVLKVASALDDSPSNSSMVLFCTMALK